MRALGGVSQPLALSWPEDAADFEEDIVTLARL